MITYIVLLALFALFSSVLMGAFSAKCGCAEIMDLASGEKCIDATPGIENTIVIVDQCEVISIPLPVANTSTIAADVTVTALYVGKILSLYDPKKNGSITGVKEADTNGEYTVEVFVPGNNDTTHHFIKTITNSNYTATIFPTDMMGNTYLMKNTSFSMKFDTLKVNEQGQAGYVLTGKSPHYALLYTGLIP